MPKMIVYRDDAGEYRWQLKARNGRIIADSGEGYAKRGNAERAALMVIRSATEAVVVFR